ncbi:ATP-dependent RNA helicase Drs1p [Diutina rugosa]
MARKSKSAPAKDDDLVLTIDSDDEQLAVEQVSSGDESDEEEETEAVSGQTKSKNNKKNKNKSKQDATKAKAKGKEGKGREEEEPKESADLNPDFQFDAEGMVTQAFDGWDFSGDSKATPQVDLDGILRRKGGLVSTIGTEKKEGKEAEDEVDEDEDEANEEANEEEADADANGDDDDDEIAMDGFGMGAQEDDEDDDDEEDDEENDDEEEQEDDDDEAVEADMDMEYPDSDADNDSDSEEAKAAFYETAAPTQAHTSFTTLQLSRPVLKGLANLGYTSPSPIQSAAIPIALLGKDIVAGAQTGSGKTAAFMIPIIERLVFKPAKVASTRVIVLTPTRELAMQVYDVGKKIGQHVKNLSFGMAVGGLNLRQQEQQLKQRPDVVIATPGRLIDHIRNSPSFSIDQLEVLVIDEADRMLDEGFQAELEEILGLIPKHKRQTLLFSATMNTKIQDLIKLSLQKPVRIMIDPPKSAASKLVQEFVRIRKRDQYKPALLYSLCRQVGEVRTVVFVSRKETAHRLRIILGLMGIKVGELHGSLTQEQRIQAVNDFKSLTVPILICTDLAARGLDIPKIETVINYDMPKSYEIYLHRVGRTARAGREGRSISFVGESNPDRAIVRDAVKSLAETKGKALSRHVDWKQIEELNQLVESKSEAVEEVLAEEKHEKQLLHAEMELNKAENMIKHEKEIASRPRRTWFSGKDQQQQKQPKKLNSKKRKRAEELSEGVRSYKKTKADRTADAQRNPKMKKGKKGKGRK